MKQYQHILCPVDFSEHSDETIAQAVSIKSITGAKLLVVHCIEPMPITSYGIGMVGVYSDRDIEKEIHQVATKKMQTIATKHNLHDDETRIEEAYARYMLPELVKEKNIDLIVIGSHNKRGILDHFLGGTANYVANHVDCDVFIVRGPST